MTIYDIIKKPVLNTEKARDLMMNAPSVVTEKQLEDVHIKVTE